MRNFYYLSSCDSCKRIMGTLSLDPSINKIDIKKNPLNISQLEELHTISGSYEVLFSLRAQLYKQRDLKNKILSEETIKELLLEHYTFLKRPVLIFDKTLFIGNSASVVAKVKTFLDEQYNFSAFCCPRSYHYLWNKSHGCKGYYASLYWSFWFYYATCSWRYNFVLACKSLDA